ncbi:MAG: hypothetical protein ACYDHX_04455 [Methanothrix sp.]
MADSRKSGAGSHKQEGLGELVDIRARLRERRGAARKKVERKFRIRPASGELPRSLRKVVQDYGNVSWSHGLIDDPPLDQLADLYHFLFGVPVVSHLNETTFQAHLVASLIYQEPF